MSHIYIHPYTTTKVVAVVVVVSVVVVAVVVITVVIVASTCNSSCRLSVEVEQYCDHPDHKLLHLYTEVWLRITNNITYSTHIQRKHNNLHYCTQQHYVA